MFQVNFSSLSHNLTCSRVPRPLVCYSSFCLRKQVKYFVNHYGSAGGTEGGRSAAAVGRATATRAVPSHVALRTHAPQYSRVNCVNVCHAVVAIVI